MFVLARQRNPSYLFSTPDSAYGHTLLEAGYASVTGFNQLEWTDKGKSALATAVMMKGIEG